MCSALSWAWFWEVAPPFGGVSPVAGIAANGKIANSSPDPATVS